MDCLTLLREARRIGLSVKGAGDRLVVHGPRHAESLAREILERKDEVLAALKGAQKSYEAATDPEAKVGWTPRTELRSLSGRNLFDLVHDPQTSDRARQAYRAELLARADAIISESDGRRPPPNPTVHTMFHEARVRFGDRDLEERTITAWLRRNAPEVATLWPEAPAGTSWFDWRRRIEPEHVEILDRALTAVVAASRIEDAR